MGNTPHPRPRPCPLSALKLWVRTLLRDSLLPHLPPAIRLKALYQSLPELRYLHPDWVHQQQQRLLLQPPLPLQHTNALLHHQYFYGPLQQLLRFEDRCSMRFSVEARTPFADDPALMTSVMNTPGAYKIHRGVRKYLLRRAMQGIVPNPVLHRTDKMGFFTPNNTWLTAIKDHFYHYLDTDPHHIFNRQLLLRDYHTFFSPRSTTDNYRIFKFLAVAIWQHTYFRRIETLRNAPQPTP